ncbi:tetratricopeptide repeat protein [Altibacter sp. HG106]|uniref:tetratricopeptide repeat protein n=1 Tax=Altibacter sp. HG106 TaxID=3023937 RepID=UPI002350D991|nr:CDC27 family protein [Altibacter sp. HG106]MDC7994087.1 CDC27 family protein [Altibacter sp. HG106]
MKSFLKFWNELRRRNVPKGIISYIVFSWVLLQVISVLGSLISIPNGTGKTILISLLILFPFWLLFSWFYDITPEGIQRTAPLDGEINAERTEAIGKKLNMFILVFLSIAVVLLIVDRSRLVSEKSGSSLAINSALHNSIAVLPFHDMSLQQNQEYFADGLAEELLNSLARIPDMRVTSRTSAFSFKSQNLDIKSIADKLNVNYILEGSVRTQDSLIRVSVKLIDTRNDRNLWAQTWDKKLRNIFQIQNDIAQAVVKHMQLHLLNASIPKSREAKATAYDMYLQAKYDYQNSIGKDKLLEVEEKLKKSLAIDPTYAPAWQLLGSVYHSQNNYGILNATDGYHLSEEALLKAMEIDSTYARTYAAMATLELDYNQDIREAEKWSQMAMELAPNDADVLDRASEVASLRGKWNEAIQLNKRAIQLDPLDDYNYHKIANTYYFAERYKASIESIKKAIEINPNNDVVYSTYALSLIQLKRYRDALAVIDNEPLEGFRLYIKAIIYHFLGNTEASKSEMRQMIETYQESYSFQISTAYAAMGEPKQMYHWLKKARENEDLGLTELPLEPLFNPYRNEKRWKEFVETLDYKY